MSVVSKGLSCFVPAWCAEVVVPKLWGKLEGLWKVAEGETLSS